MCMRQVDSITIPVGPRLGGKVVEVSALRKAGLERVGSVPADRLTELMRADLAKWGDVIRRANITLEN